MRLLTMKNMYMLIATILFSLPFQGCLMLEQDPDFYGGTNEESEKNDSNTENNDDSDTAIMCGARQCECTPQRIGAIEDFKPGGTLGGAVVAGGYLYTRTSASTSSGEVNVIDLGTEEPEWIGGMKDFSTVYDIEIVGDTLLVLEDRSYGSDGSYLLFVEATHRTNLSLAYPNGTWDFGSSRQLKLVDDTTVMAIYGGSDGKFSNTFATDYTGQRWTADFSTLSNPQITDAILEDSVITAIAGNKGAYIYARFIDELPPVHELRYRSNNPDASVQWLEVDDPVVALEFDGEYAFAGFDRDEDNFAIYEISDDSSPKRIDSITFDSNVTDIQLSGNLAYLTTVGHEVHIVDISSKTSIKPYGFLEPSGISVGIALDKVNPSEMYVVTPDGIDIYTICEQP
ncbi:MAG: hypothetical protein JXR76_18925 [Deltaproteobacteria bacterium]|nr:hypothetical protein [Deltaproteobacteria bacterium]